MTGDEEEEEEEEEEVLEDEVQDEIEIFVDTTSESFNESYFNNEEAIATKDVLINMDFDNSIQDKSFYKLETDLLKDESRI